MTVSFRAFAPEDAAQLQLQPSQWMQAGIAADAMTAEQATALHGQGEAWTAMAADGRLLCCAGIAELFPGRHGIAWSMLASDLGVRQHMAITRFARDRIAASPLPRIECLVEDDAAGRGAKWAEACGMRLRAAMPMWGPASADVLLFDRIKPCRD